MIQNLNNQQFYSIMYHIDLINKIIIIHLILSMNNDLMLVLIYLAISPYITQMSYIISHLLMTTSSHHIPILIHLILNHLIYPITSSITSLYTIYYLYYLYYYYYSHLLILNLHIIIITITHSTITTITTITIHSTHLILMPLPFF